MKKVAISVKQPWAYLLCAGIKNIENRTWKLPEKYIGKRVYIHASAKPITKGFYSAPFPSEFWDNLTAKRKDELAHNIDTCSAIIGSVEFVDCVINHPSVWAERTAFKSAGIPSFGGFELALPDLEKPIYNWVVANPIIFDKPIPCKGKLSFWDCTELIKEE